MKYLLGIDSGGTVTKAAIFDNEGKEIASAEVQMDVVIPHIGYTERKFENFRQGNIEVIRKVIKKSAIDAKDIIGISLTGQGNGLYLFDENGNCIRRPILSGDIRAKDILKKWYEDGTADKVASKTYQSIWAGQMAPLMAWFKENEPQSLKKAKYAITCKCYVGYMLTGVFCTEISEASSTSCMDMNTKRFDAKLMGLLGIEEYISKLTPIVSSTEIFGYVTKEAEELTGLKKGTAVVGGLFDIVACAIATGVTSSDTLSIVVGTWSINEYISKTLQGDKDLMLVCYYCIDGYTMMNESSTTSAVNLQWFIDKFMQEEKADLAGASLYDRINEMVSSIPVNDYPLIFLPFLFGSNVNPDAKGGFIGLSGIHSKAHMLRAIYEGVVFSHKMHIEKLHKYKSNFSKICISGGGAKSEVWVQMFADVIGLPVEVSAVAELGTMGAAMCAGVGVGQYKDMREASAVFTKTSKTIYPNKENTVHYERKYQVYKAVIDALDSTWCEFEKESI